MKRRPATLSGKVLNCAIWIPDEYGGWKCGGYARACKPDKCAEPSDPKKKQAKVCTRKQKVFSPFLDKKVSRCKKYAPACTGRPCMDSSMPYPTEPSEKTKPSPMEIRSIASWMAAEYNEETFGKEPYLAREILDRGGIRAFRRGALKEEYKTIPLFLKNKSGLPADEMANEMGFETERELMEAIHIEYPPKTKGEWKTKKLRKKTSDFIDAAYEYIEEKIFEQQWV